jgi:hypothetical protein
MFLSVSEIPEDVGIQKQLTSIHIEEWMKEDVFHLKWWLLIGLILIFLFAWWKAADKSKFRDVCLFAALVTIAALGINEYGEELTLWDYPTDIIPIFPPLSSINLISLPLTYSIVYQYFRTRWGFIWAALAITALICLVIEPALEWAGLYQLIKWRHYYSFPIYAVMVIGIREAINKINDINERYNTKTGKIKSIRANK